MTMGTVAAIGTLNSVCGLALAGVDVMVAEGPDAVRRTWQGLPDTVDLVILTAEAAEALGAEATAPAHSRPLTVVMSR
jgi:vacuolar-type H+-ATPase subunit F/Vma7